MALKSWSEMMKDAETNVTGFQPLEPASYDFVIEKPAEVGETSKGYPKFTIRATVESGPRANAVQIHRFNASESAYAMKEFFFKPLYAIGITPEFLSADPTNEQIANAFQGKRFSARVEKQKDSDYMQLVDFAPASGAAPVRNQPGVPSGVPSGVPAGVPQAQAAPAVQAPAPAAAPVQQAAPAPAAPVPDASPAVPPAPATDGNPWASSPPPPPVF